MVVGVGLTDGASDSLGDAEALASGDADAEGVGLTCGCMVAAGELRGDGSGVLGVDGNGDGVGGMEEAEGDALGAGRGDGDIFGRGLALGEGSATGFANSLIVSVLHSVAGNPARICKSQVAMDAVILDMQAAMSPERH